MNFFQYAEKIYGKGHRMRTHEFQQLLAEAVAQDISIFDNISPADKQRFADQVSNLNNLDCNDNAIVSAMIDFFDTKKIHVPSFIEKIQTTKGHIVRIVKNFFVDYFFHLRLHYLRTDPTREF
jgi:hypothetical protein